MTKTSSPLRTPLFLLFATIGLVLGLRLFLGAAVHYDFVAKAPEAKWSRNATPGGVLPWNGPDTDNRGFVRFVPNAVLENGKTYDRVLLTHPEWKEGGIISSTYPNVKIPAKSEFHAVVGFLQGADTSDGVVFEVHVFDQTTGAITKIATSTVRYDRGLNEMKADLAGYAGKTVTFKLQVNAGGTATRDWAVWTSAAVRDVVERPAGAAISVVSTTRAHPAGKAIPKGDVAKAPPTATMTMFKPALIAKVPLRPVGSTPPPKHKIEDAGTLPIEEPLTVLNRIYKDNEKANTYYFLPREINLIRDGASGDYRISAVWTEDQKIRTTLALQANIDPSDVRILEEALRKAKGSQAALRSMPYDEANIIDMKGWEDWQIEDIRIPSFGSLESELPISIAMTPETLAQLKPLLEKEGLTAGMHLKTGEVEREIPIKVGLKYATGRMYSSLDELSFSFRRPENLLTLHGLRNLSEFPLRIQAINLRFRFGNGDEIYKSLGVQGNVIIPPGGSAEVTAKLTPQPLLAAEMARILPPPGPPQKKMNPLLKQALEKLKEGLEKETGIEAKEPAPAGETVDPKVDAFFKSSLKSYWLDAVPDFDCQECFDKIWGDIEVVSYIERMRKINIEVLANVFDPAAYEEAPLEIEKVHVEIRSPYLSAQAREGLLAAADLNKDKLSEAIVVYLPLSNQETFWFEFKIKAVLKSGESAESAGWEKVEDSLDMTFGTFHIKKIFGK